MRILRKLGMKGAVQVTVRRKRKVSTLEKIIYWLRFWRVDRNIEEVK